MVIAVESELHVAVPLESDGPQRFRPIILIERVASINEEESQFLILGGLIPLETHHVNSPLYTRLHNPAQFLRPIILLHLLSGHLGYALCHHPPPVSPTLTGIDGYYPFSITLVFW